MDKRVAYAGAIPQTLDILRTNYAAELGITKLAQAVIGTGPAVRGLNCTVTSPASLGVYVTPGEVYALASLLPVAYSAMAADTTHQVLKQGIVLDQVTLSTPAPITSGQSINYLVQVAMVEADADLAVLQYYNAANPSQPFSGAGGNGVAQAQTRQCTVSIGVKVGTSAATGSQVTPTPDAGYIGLWVVTVAFGASTVTSGNITKYPGAPFISSTGLRPAFGALLSAGKTLPNNAATKIQFDSEEFDSNNNYDPTTNYRFTPTVAGTYAVTLTANLGAGASPGTFWVAVYKNGSTGRAGPTIPMPGTQAIGSSLSTLVILNGTTDYIEFYAYQSSGASQTIQQSGTHVQAVLVA